MKKLLPILLLISLSCSTEYNQETINLEGEQILVGLVNWSGFTSPPYNEWFTPTYKSYQVDSVSLSSLNQEINTIDMMLFMGTWCSDSQLQVPQFYKILDHLNYDVSNMIVPALEKSESGKLESPQHEEEGFEITHVPTIIFLKNGKEIGRITEYPDQTLEKDMVNILKF
jgi:thiol-disulfide isomerase/thioredoxin